MNIRIQLDESSRIELFALLATLSLTVNEVAQRLDVSARTVRDWRNGRYTIPHKQFSHMVKLANKKPSDFCFKELEEGWHRSKAGQAGGRAYMDRYGQLGSMQTRARGGRRSYEARKDNPEDIFARKEVFFPARSVELAEFIGIMLGDGSLTKYQAMVSLDAETDRDYAMWVVSLIERLFTFTPALQYRKERRCVVIVMSSVALTEFLIECGLPMGHKLRAGLDVPDWIKSNPQFAAACIRGLFDTDGSIFQEIHHYKDRTYAYPRFSLVSLSPNLLETVLEVLLSLGINAKIRGGRCVSIERFTDIDKYYTIIGSSNLKHRRRLAAFIGGVG